MYCDECIVYIMYLIYSMAVGACWSVSLGVTETAQNLFCTYILTML